MINQHIKPNLKASEIDLLQETMIEAVSRNCQTANDVYMLIAEICKPYI